MPQSLTERALRQAGSSGAPVGRERRRIKVPLCRIEYLQQGSFTKQVVTSLLLQSVESTAMQPCKVLHCTERPRRAAAHCSVAGDQHARRPAASVLLQIHLAERTIVLSSGNCRSSPLSRMPPATSS